jgi:hypothetical protein
MGTYVLSNRRSPVKPWFNRGEECKRLLRERLNENQGSRKTGLAAVPRLIEVAKDWLLAR